MYLSNTSLFDGRDMYRIYYIKNNYMLRHLTLVIFRLRNERWPMSGAETCSCSLCSKFYTYLQHQIKLC